MLISSQDLSPQIISIPQILSVSLSTKYLIFPLIINYYHISNKLIYSTKPF